MKTSTALKKAAALHTKIEDLMLPHDKKLREITGDDCAHFTYQPSDGWCIAYRGGRDNAAVHMLDIDKIMTMSGTDLLDAIDKAGI